MFDIKKFLIESRNPLNETLGKPDIIKAYKVVDELYQISQHGTYGGIITPSDIAALKKVKNLLNVLSVKLFKR